MNRSAAPRKVVIESPDLVTLHEAAKTLGIKRAALVHYHVRRAGLAVIRLGRVQAIKRADLPTLAAAIADSRMRRENVRRGLSPDGRYWGSRRTAEALGMSVRTLKRAARSGTAPAPIAEDGQWWWSPEEVTRVAAKQHD